MGRWGDGGEGEGGKGEMGGDWVKGGYEERDDGVWVRVVEGGRRYMNGS